MYLINAPFYPSTSKKQFPINCFCWDGRRDASPTLGFDILQSCFDRILANVVPVELQLGAGADDVIVAFILPDRSRGTDGLVDGFGGEGLGSEAGRTSHTLAEVSPEGGHGSA